jgi:hypothetical protein
MPFGESEQNGGFANIYSSYIDNAMERLQAAKSHGEFERTFHEITSILLLDCRENSSSAEKVYEVIHRYNLMVSDV